MHVIHTYILQVNCARVYCCTSARTLLRKYVCILLAIRSIHTYIVL